MVVSYYYFWVRVQVGKKVREIILAVWARVVGKEGRKYGRLVGGMQGSVGEPHG